MTFFSAHNLKNHMVIHEEPRIKCPECPQLFRRASGLRRHSYLHKNVKYVCDICGAELRSPDRLTIHKSKCECQLNYGMDWNGLFINEFHFTESHIAKTDYLECKVCFKKLKGRKHLQRHVRAQHTIRESKWYRPNFGFENDFHSFQTF